MFLASRPMHAVLVGSTVIGGLIIPVRDLGVLRSGPGFGAFRRATGYDSDLVAFWAVLALAELWVLTLRYVVQEKRAGRPRSLDRVAARLVVVAVNVTTCAERLLDVGDRHVRSLVGALEKAAREAEHSSLLSVAWQDRARRHAVRADGVRLAEVIRAHKAPLMRARRPDDFTDVAWSLTGGDGAWARGDFAAMVRGAPEVVVPGRSWPWLVRFGPALVLRGNLGRMCSAFGWYFRFLVRPGEG